MVSLLLYLSGLFGWGRSPHSP
jgi:hypothetical protein